MLFVKPTPGVTGEHALQMQVNMRDYERKMAEKQNGGVIGDLFQRDAMLANWAQMRGLAVNEGRIPQDVYREFDNITITEMRSDDGDTFLNDLLPLSRAISIGKLTYEYRRSSDAGRVRTSMTGQNGVIMDQVDYNIDGFIIPVHDAGFSRNWREYAAGTSEGFDALIDDQRETVRTVRSSFADDFLDGHRDEDGNLIVVDQRQWAGMRNDTRVEQIDLGVGGINFDFTDDTKTGDEIKAALIQVLNVMWIINNCAKDLTVYVSREIARNWERNFSTEYDGRRIIDQLSGLQGVAAIKVTNKMTSNEMMGFPLDGSVRPVSGMGLATMAMPRLVYNSNYEFVTAHATGWTVTNDYFGKTCAFYAAG